MRTPPVTVVEHDSFSHEALLYTGPDDLIAKVDIEPKLGQSSIGAHEILLIRRILPRHPLQTSCQNCCYANFIALLIPSNSGP